MITKENLDQLFEWGSSVEFPLKYLLSSQVGEKILMETIGEDIG